MLSAIAIVTINGFCFVATILAVTKKPHEAADSTQPLLTIYYQATGSKAGSICLTMLQPVSFVLGSIDTTATSARMAYALARDGGMPWSQLFAKVPSHFRVPVIGHVWCFCWDIVLALIFLASGNAFNTIISAAVVSFTISHAMPTGISVLRRRRLLPENRAFKPPGLFGYICNIVAVAWAILTTFLFVWPTNSPTNAENMNYCIAAFGVFILVSGSNWIFSARKHYTPPALAIITPDEPQCAGRVAESDFTDKTEGVMTEKAEDITIANSDREME